MKDKFFDAFLIGFSFAIIIWSIAKNTFGIISLIPLYFIYKVVQKSKGDKTK